jgi:hypothetical protein
MKILGLVLGLCLITTLAFAGAEGEVISIDKDDNGNIRVWTQYKVDGVEVESRYPKINGKSVFCSRYHFLNFVGMTDTEIKTKILEDVNIHAETLIRKTYILKKNRDIFDNHLKNVTTSKVSKETTIIKIDTDGDNIPDKEYMVKTDGTETITPIPTP